MTAKELLKFIVEKAQHHDHDLVRQGPAGPITLGELFEDRPALWKLCRHQNAVCLNICCMISNWTPSPTLRGGARGLPACMNVHPTPYK